MERNRQTRKTNSIKSQREKKYVKKEGKKQRQNEIEKEKREKENGEESKHNWFTYAD